MAARVDFAIGGGGCGRVDFVRAPSPTKPHREIAARNIAAPRDVTDAGATWRARLATPLAFRNFAIVQELELVALVGGDPSWVVTRRRFVIGNLSKIAHPA